MKTQRIHRASHPPYLTLQPLYLCHHTDGTHLCIDVSLYWWHHNKCVSHHTWKTYDIIPNLHPITVTLYDINDHVLWYHIHGIHDIRSSLCDIINSVVLCDRLDAMSSAVQRLSNICRVWWHQHRVLWWHTEWIFCQKHRRYVITDTLPVKPSM